MHLQIHCGTVFIRLRKIGNALCAYAYQDLVKPAEIKEAVAATVVAVAEQLRLITTESGEPLPYGIELVTEESVHHLSRYVQSKERAHQVDWDWVGIFRDYVTTPSSGWMYALIRKDDVGSMCCGRIELDFEEEVVTVERLERLPDAELLRGLATLVADLFATTLAELIEAKAVLLVDPDPDLLTHYARFGYLPHTDEDGDPGKVTYMRKEV